MIAAAEHIGNTSVTIREMDALLIKAEREQKRKARRASLNIIRIHLGMGRVDLAANELHMMRSWQCINQRWFLTLNAWLWAVQEGILPMNDLKPGVIQK
jgi:hypothetical protein